MHAKALKVSLFSQISGSASYVKDEIETEEYVRMTFSYRKKGKQITAISEESILDDSACSINGATHVVTELKYGFNAFLIFEMEETESYSKQDIEGNLEIVIKKIPAVEISGSGSIELTSNETDIVNSLRFKFHGDTVIDPPPQSFDEAIAVYQGLPAASEGSERVVSFSIAPLYEYCDASAEILNSISNANIEAVSNVMVDFEQVRKRLRRLKKKDLALDFSRYRLVLLDLEKRFESARSEFISEIQTILPNIRSGDADDSELTTLLENYSTSVYEKEAFLALLATRQKEIETAEFIIYHDSLPNTTFIDLDHTGDMAECIIGHEYAVVYELEILPQNSTIIGDQYDDGSLDESGKWFMDETQVGLNQPLMTDFIELAEQNAEGSSASICFLISLNEYGESADAFQLKLLKGGTVIVDGFNAPPTIWQVDEADRGYDTAELTLYHDEASEILLDSSYYELVAIYESIDENVRFILKVFEYVSLMWVIYFREQPLQDLLDTQR